MSYMYKQPAVKKTEPAAGIAGKKPAGSASTPTTAATKPAATTAAAKPTVGATDKKPTTAAAAASSTASSKTTSAAATTPAKPTANGTASSTASTASKTSDNKTAAVSAAAKTATPEPAKPTPAPAADKSSPAAKPSTAAEPKPAEKEKEKLEEATKKLSVTDDSSKPQPPTGRKGSTRAENRPRFRYDYHKLFDAREYRNSFYDYSKVTTADEQLNAEHNPLGFVIRTQYAFLKEINKTLTKVEKKKKEELIMLDIGTGPSIVPACLGTVFDVGTVICSDFTPACRTLLQLWWWGREDTFDWQPITKYISTLAATEKKPVEDPLIFEERARLKLQAIFSCDVEQANVLSPNQLDQCDVLTSSLAFECAASEVEEYEAIIERCNNSIRINGYIVFAGMLNASWYKTSAESDLKFKVQPITEEDVRRGLKYAGFDNVEIRTLPLTPQQHGKFLGKLCDASDVFVARAQKIKAMEYDQEE